ncbi:MAG: RidA family protein, partial [Halobacteriales archaeon]|nr:RidA family protein [Halobacteriales archaeon]
SFETQVRSAFDHVSACLEAGNAGLDDLVHMRVYLDDMGDAWEFLQLRREILGEHLTTRSLIGQRPPSPGQREAIEVRAIRP